MCPPICACAIHWCQDNIAVRVRGDAISIYSFQRGWERTREPDGRHSQQGGHWFTTRHNDTASDSSPLLLGVTRLFEIVNKQ